MASSSQEEALRELGRAVKRDELEPEAINRVRKAILQSDLPEIAPSDEPVLAVAVDVLLPRILDSN